MICDHLRKLALEVERHNHQQALDACDALIAERDAAQERCEYLETMEHQRNEARAENARLRAALEKLIEHHLADDGVVIAREALAKETP